MDLAVSANVDRRLDNCSGRVVDRDPALHQRFYMSRDKRSLSQHQITPGIDTKCLSPIVQDQRRYRMRLGRSTKSICQIELTLGVVRVEARQILEDRRRGQNIDPGVVRSKSQLLRRRVGGFDDPLERLVVPQYNSAERSRTVHLGNHHRSPLPLRSSQK